MFRRSIPAYVRKNSRLDSILILSCEHYVVSISCLNTFRLCPLCLFLPVACPRACLASCPCLGSCCGVSFSPGQSHP